MPLYRLQCSWLKDTAFPRDRIVITPHFDDRGVGSDAQGLCDDMAAGLQAIHNSTGEVRVTAYDAKGTKPVYPAGEKILNTGLTQATTVPREVAVCLSFYAERNIPRRRGRIYVPLFLTGLTSPGLRPPNQLMALESLVTLFAGLGGVDVDWVVFSRRDNAPFKVTNWWYDNEWDIQRSRGLRASNRAQGTTSG